MYRPNSSWTAQNTQQMRYYRFTGEELVEQPLEQLLETWLLASKGDGWHIGCHESGVGACPAYRTRTRVLTARSGAPHDKGRKLFSRRHL